MTPPLAPMLAGVGYQRRDLAEVVGLLHTHAIDTVVDVRSTARSRLPDFARTRLSAGLAQAGIDYLHFRPLGNPPDNRDGVRRGDPGALARYDQVLASGAGRDALDQLVAVARHGRVALLCHERDGSTCHRRAVLAAVREREPALEIASLGD